MALFQISVGDDLKARIESRAAEGGYGSIEAYLEALLRADLDADVVDDPDLERLLLRRLESGPAIEFTPEFARRFKQQRRERGTQGDDGDQ